MNKASFFKAKQRCWPVAVLSKKFNTDFLANACESRPIPVLVFSTFLFFYAWVFSHCKFVIFFFFKQSKDVGQ